MEESCARQSKFVLHAVFRIHSHSQLAWLPDGGPCLPGFHQKCWKEESNLLEISKFFARSMNQLIFLLFWGIITKYNRIKKCKVPCCFLKTKHHASVLQKGGILTRFRIRFRFRLLIFLRTVPVQAPAPQHCHALYTVLVHVLLGEAEVAQ